MDNIREKVLENAKELLESNGLKGLTVQNIIEKCNMGKTTFYKIFPTKKDLLFQLKHYCNNVDIKFISIKDQIAEAAKEAFSKYGITGMNMDIVAREVKLNRVTLYRYFSNKDELLEYCVNSEFNKIKSILSKNLELLDNPELALVECFSLFVTLRKTFSGNSLISETWNNANRNKKIFEYFSDLYDSFENTFKLILMAGIKKGIFKSDINIQSLISMLLIILNGVMFTFTHDNDLYIDDSVLESMIGIFLNDIKKSEVPNDDNTIAQDF